MEKFVLVVLQGFGLICIAYGLGLAVKAWMGGLPIRLFHPPNLTPIKENVTYPRGLPRQNCSLLL